jgi:hypothetical protein
MYTTAASLRPASARRPDVPGAAVETVDEGGQCLPVGQRPGERAGAHTVEVTASHTVTVSQPDAVVDLIREAARATAG